MDDEVNVIHHRIPRGFVALLVVVVADSADPVFPILITEL
jgi:hypothetical protein